MALGDDKLYNEIINDLTNNISNDLTGFGSNLIYDCTPGTVYTDDKLIFADTTATSATYTYHSYEEEIAKLTEQVELLLEIIKQSPELSKIADNIKVYKKLST